MQFCVSRFPLRVSEVCIFVFSAHFVFPCMHGRTPVGTKSPRTHLSVTLHTKGCLGLFEAIGDVDFYPNGGDHQPGCADSGTEAGNLLDMISELIHIKLYVAAFCSAQQNVKYFNLPYITWSSLEF